MLMTPLHRTPFDISSNFFPFETETINPNLALPDPNLTTSRISFDVLTNVISLMGFDVLDFDAAFFSRLLTSSSEIVYFQTLKNISFEKFCWTTNLKSKCL
jgi:hypothetical protein